MQNTKFDHQDYFPFLQRPRQGPTGSPVRGASCHEQSLEHKDLGWYILGLGRKSHSENGDIYFRLLPGQWLSNSCRNSFRGKITCNLKNFVDTCNYVDFVGESVPRWLFCGVRLCTCS